MSASAAASSSDSTLQIPTPEVFEPLLRPARYKGAFGGRGSGKSWFYAAQLIKRCILDPDTRAVCVREVQRSLDQSVKLLLEDTIERLGVGSRFRILNTHIEPVGNESGTILFQGMQNHTAESIKSLEGYDIAWVEEAQALSQRSLDLLRPTIRKEGSELWFSWNPRSATDPVDVLLRGESPPPDSEVVETTWKDNPWFPDVLRTEMEWDRGRNREKYEHVWGGKYLERSEAQVFKNVEVRDFETPENSSFLFGGDWGFSVDPSVLVRCFIDGRTLYIDYEAYQIGCEIDYLPFLFGGTADPDLRKLNQTAFDDMAKKPPEYRSWRGVPGARRWPIIADSARPETIDYMLRHGFPKIRGARKGPGSVEEGIEFLQSYDIVVHEKNCVHTAEELATYCYKTDRLTDEVLPVLEDGREHCIDSVRYAVENVRRKKPRAGTWGRKHRR